MYLLGRRIVATFALAFATLTLGVAPSGAAGSDPVSIPDAALKTCVASTLGVPNTDPITEDQMAGLTQLHCQSQGVTNLTGLEYAVNLSYVDVAANPIATLAPLAALTTLLAVNVSATDVTSIAPLANSTGLTSLTMAQDDVASLSPIAGFGDLTYLNISYSSVTDLSDLAASTHLSLFLANNTAISDLSPFSGFTELTYVSISHTDVTAIDVLADSLNLNRLYMTDTEIEDISALGSGGSNLEYFEANNSKVNDLDPLWGQTSLLSVWINSTNVSDITGLTDADLLREFSAYGTDITSIAALANTPDLNFIQLEASDVSDLTPLANSAALQYMYLGGIPITTLVPIKNLRNVEYLDVTGTSLTSLDGVQGWTKLSTIRAINAPIGDLDALAGTPNLTSVTVSGGELDDVSGLVTLREVTIASVSYNQLWDVWDMRHVPGDGIDAYNQGYSLDDAVACVPFVAPRFRDSNGVVYGAQEINGVVPLLPLGTHLRTTPGGGQASYVSDDGLISMDAVQTISAATVPCDLSAYASAEISGTRAVGRTLTAAPRNTPESGAYTYQWYRGATQIVGATNATYVPVKADRGKKVSVEVTVSHPGIVTVTVHSAGTKIGKKLNASNPTISGTPSVGAKLTAKRGSWASSVKFKYQWYRDGVAISGATKSTYTVKSADQGREVTVRVTGAKSGYRTEVRYSAPVDANVSFYAAPAPGISGTPAVGSTLSSLTDGWEPSVTAPTFTYQWYRSGKKISGATSSDYTLTGADLGKYIKVTITVSRPGFGTSVRTSSSVRITS